jgi:hypothetical protein
MFNDCFSLFVDSMDKVYPVIMDPPSPGSVQFINTESIVTDFTENSVIALGATGIEWVDLNSC